MLADLSFRGLLLVAPTSVVGLAARRGGSR